ncbi:MAG: gliding motility-associated ABC transporter substrate-binding protein GldG [Chitinophagaceae bacterium]|nr:gliding motility-associated ABC transporter substrate-binding protein GldG [Chitinophagaceae bacterium]
MIKKIFSSKLGLPVMIILLAGINWAASVWHSRIDLTNENRFTLSDVSVKLLQKLNEPVTVEVFLKGHYPSGFRKLSASTQDVLREFKEVAGTKIQYRFISPDETLPGTSMKYGDTLAGIGLFPINLTSQVEQGQQQQFVYPFALVHYKDKSIPVTLYQGKTPLINFQELSGAEALLEYNFINAISKVTQLTKPTVAYAMGNGEPNDIRIYDLMERYLKADYDLQACNLVDDPFIPGDFKVLLVVKPTLPFTEAQKLKLDQYVMNGGKILWFIDRLNAEMDSLQLKNEVIAYDRDLQLNDLFFKYGVRQNADLVMDLQCDYLPFDVNGNGQFEFLPWNYFPVFEGNNNHPINKNLGFVVGRFVNSIDTVEAEGISKTILLSSSANSRTISTPALISGKENVNAPEDAKFNKTHIPVAVLLEGKFISLYRNRLSQAMRDSLARYDQPYLPQNVSGTKMIVVSDGDMVLNSVFKNNPLPMGANPFTYGSQRDIPFANGNFLENCMEYLVNENNLMEAKSKEYVVRLLDSKKVKQEKTTLQIINIIVPVLTVILFALLFGWLRKRKYSR